MGDSLFCREGSSLAAERASFPRGLPGGLGAPPTGPLHIGPSFVGPCLLCSVNAALAEPSPGCSSLVQGPGPWLTGSRHLSGLAGSRFRLALDRINLPFSPRALVSAQRDSFLKNESRASLVAQWLRIRLPVQGTRVQALVWEDPTCRGATGPVNHNY